MKVYNNIKNNTNEEKRRYGIDINENDWGVEGKFDLFKKKINDNQKETHFLNYFVKTMFNNEFGNKIKDKFNTVTGLTDSENNVIGVNGGGFCMIWALNCLLKKEDKLDGKKLLKWAIDDKYKETVDTIVADYTVKVGEATDKDKDDIKKLKKLIDNNDSEEILKFDLGGGNLGKNGLTTKKANLNEFWIKVIANGLECRIITFMEQITTPSEQELKTRWKEQFGGKIDYDSNKDSIMKGSFSVNTVVPEDKKYTNTYFLYNRGHYWPLKKKNYNDDDDELSRIWNDGEELTGTGGGLSGGKTYFGIGNKNTSDLGQLNNITFDPTKHYIGPDKPTAIKIMKKRIEDYKKKKNESNLHTDFLFEDKKYDMCEWFNNQNLIKEFCDKIKKLQNNKNDPPEDDDQLDTILTEENIIKEYVTGYLKIKDGVHLITLHLKDDNNKKGGIIRAADILKDKLDVIVNAANESGTKGGAVDGAINKNGGDGMKKEREAYMKGRKPPNKLLAVAEGFSTGGHGLGCNHVIHMNSFNYGNITNGNFDNGDKKLKEAYTESLRIADEKLNAKNIAFSLLSSGIFNGNRGVKEVLEIGIQAINEYNASNLKNVFMVSYKDNEKEALKEALKGSGGKLYSFDDIDVKDKDKDKDKDKGSGSGDSTYKPCMEFTYNDDGSWCAKIVKGDCETSVKVGGKKSRKKKKKSKRNLRKRRYRKSRKKNRKSRKKDY